MPLLSTLGTVDTSIQKNPLQFSFLFLSLWRSLSQYILMLPCNSEGGTLAKLKWFLEAAAAHQSTPLSYLCNLICLMPKNANLTTTMVDKMAATSRRYWAPRKNILVICISPFKQSFSIAEWFCNTYLAFAAVYLINESLALANWGKRVPPPSLLIKALQNLFSRRCNKRFEHIGHKNAFPRSLSEKLKYSSVAKSSHSLAKLLISTSFEGCLWSNLMTIWVFNLLSTAVLMYHRMNRRKIGFLPGNWTMVILAWERGHRPLHHPHRQNTPILL